MKTIWKFPLDITDSQTILMPKGAELLIAQLQGGQGCLWALVDDAAPREERTIEIHGTGNPIHQDMGIERKYIGTFQQEAFVWHVFERIN